MYSDLLRKAYKYNGVSIAAAAGVIGCPVQTLKNQFTRDSWTIRKAEKAAAAAGCRLALVDMSGRVYTVDRSGPVPCHVLKMEGGFVDD